MATCCLTDDVWEVRRAGNTCVGELSFIDDGDASETDSLMSVLVDRLTGIDSFLLSEIQIHKN